MQSGCTVFQLLLLCMSLRCLKCYRMAIRLGKSETFAFPSTVFQMRRALATMWTFILLHSAYLTVTFAQTTSPEFCPGICECSKSIVKCTQRDLKRIPDNISEDVTILWVSWLSTMLKYHSSCDVSVYNWYTNLQCQLAYYKVICWLFDLLKRTVFRDLIYHLVPEISTHFIDFNYPPKAIRMYVKKFLLSPETFQSHV